MVMRRDTTAEVFITILPPRPLLSVSCKQLGLHLSANRGTRRRHGVNRNK